MSSLLCKTGVLFLKRGMAIAADKQAKPICLALLSLSLKSSYMTPPAPWMVSGGRLTYFNGYSDTSAGVLFLKRAYPIAAGAQASPACLALGTLSLKSLCMAPLAPWVVSGGRPTHFNGYSDTFAGVLLLKRAYPTAAGALASPGAYTADGPRFV